MLTEAPRDVKRRAKRLSPTDKAYLVELCRADKDAATIIREFGAKTGVTIYPATVYKCRQRDRNFSPRTAPGASTQACCVHCQVAPGEFPAVPWGHKHGKICKGCMEAIQEERRERQWQETVARFYAERQQGA